MRLRSSAPHQAMKFTLLTLLALMLAAPSVQADERASREREALRRAQLALRDAQAATVSLQQEKAQESAQLHEEIKQTSAQLNRAQSRAKSSEREVTALTQKLALETKQREEQAAQLQQAKTQIDGLTIALQESRNKVSNLEKLAQAHEADLNVTRARVGACEAKNEKLYAYGTELLAAYQRKGPLDALLQREPLLGLKQVEIDNVLQEYRDKLDFEKLPPSQPQAAPALPR
jgi:chromosome segregation ATPase